jgi:hypothetical protein
MTVIRALALVDYFRRRLKHHRLTESELKLYKEATDFIDEYCRVDVHGL